MRRLRLFQYGIACSGLTVSVFDLIFNGPSAGNLILLTIFIAAIVREFCEDAN